MSVLHFAPRNNNQAQHSITLRLALPVAFLLLCGLVMRSGSDTALASDTPTGSSGSGAVMQAFQAASRQWHVPLPVLMAVGWVESHWEQRSGEPADDFGYGIMHITERADGNMASAIALTKLSADLIKSDASANISAGASVLSDISRSINTSKFEASNVVDWYPVVAEYSGSSDPLVRDQYAQEVFRVIKAGQSSVLQSGEAVILIATTVDEVPVALPLPSAGNPDSDDYPNALWVPAYSGNYTAGRPYPPLDKIVIHDTEGSYASAISWFQNPSSAVSAHFVIRSSDGQITQMVRNANTAWHAGVWDYNVRAIGIEHEGFMSQQGWYTEAMYQSSAALVRSLTDNYGIKKDRAHIIGHYQIPNQSHTDPGPNWDWTYYMSLVRRDSQVAARVDNTDAGFAATPAQIDPQHYWWTYANGYNGSSTYATTSVVNQSSSVNSGVWSTQLPSSGYYDVYAFIPYVDNSTADTTSARYHVFGTNGDQVVTVSQGAITDVGTGSWANLGKFLFTGGVTSRVSLSDWTGESGKNVWFDAMMWIPSATGDPPPTPQITPTAIPSPTRTRTPAPPTATSSATLTPVPTNTPTPTWTPGPCGMRFTDLPDDHWAYAYVNYLYCHGAISGYSDETFRPNDNSTRAQFTKILVVSMGWTPYEPPTPTFSDVLPGSTFYSYVEAAVQHGVISGYADGTFQPGNPITRAQAAKILVLGKQWVLASPPTATFTDVPLDHWAFAYVETALLHGFVTGYPDGTFQPEQPISRAQLSKLVALTAQAP